MDDLGAEPLPAPLRDRFSGLVRLYGAAGFWRLHRWRVAVIGVGGVGSWAAEALARSGVGYLRLVDGDDVCISNSNRQLHALAGQYGRPKVRALAERLAQINPHLEIDAQPQFFGANTPALLDQVDAVVDAIDSVAAKAALLAACYRQRLPVVSAGAAGGRVDPLQLQAVDMSQAGRDPLLKAVRTRLYRDFGLPKGALLGLPAVISRELPRYPDGDGGVCATKSAATPVGLALDCGDGLGASMTVTAAMGLALVAQLIQRRLALPTPDER